MTITDLISVTSHIVIAIFITIYFYYLFHIIFIFSKNFCEVQPVVVLYVLR